MTIEQPRMTPPQMAALLDTAMAMPMPSVHLDSAVSLFGMLGRHDDARAVAWMNILLTGNEIEALMTLRAALRRGEAQGPVDLEA